MSLIENVVSGIRKPFQIINEELKAVTTEKECKNLLTQRKTVQAAKENLKQLGLSALGIGVYKGYQAYMGTVALHIGLPIVAVAAAVAIFAFIYFNKFGNWDEKARRMITDEVRFAFVPKHLGILFDECRNPLNPKIETQINQIAEIFETPIHYDSKTRRCLIGLDLISQDPKRAIELTLIMNRSDIVVQYINPLEANKDNEEGFNKFLKKNSVFAQIYLSALVEKRKSLDGCYINQLNYFCQNFDKTFQIQEVRDERGGLKGTVVHIFTSLYDDQEKFFDEFSNKLWKAPSVIYMLHFFNLTDKQLEDIKKKIKDTGLERTFQCDNEKPEPPAEPEPTTDPDVDEEPKEPPTPQSEQEKEASQVIGINLAALNEIYSKRIEPEKNEEPKEEESEEDSVTDPTLPT